MDQEILDYPLRIVLLPLLVGKADGSIFLVFFINSMQQQTTGQFLPYVTSAFSLHSLIPVIGIVSNITTGVMKPPLAKILDVFGRFEGLAISLLFSVIGLILMASCTSVQIYAAANIFYWVGYKSSLPMTELMTVACSSPSKSS
jgi:fucose permease